MTLFVVAVFVITALLLVLWVLVRPLADEPLVREEAEPSAFSAEDRATCSDSLADADASGSSTIVVAEGQRRVGEGTRSSLESR
jgi:hypothetical protein